MKFFSIKWSISMVLLLTVIFPLSCTKNSTSSGKPKNFQAFESSIFQGEIRILTINVWSGLTYKGFFKMGRYPDDLQGRYELLVSEICKLAPDIIAIQEANLLPHSAKRLAKDLDYEVIYRVALGGIRFGSFGIPTNMREGQAILVKKPWTIEDLDKKRLGGQGMATNWLCLHFGEITQSLLGRATIHSKPLYTYNVHLHEGPFKGAVLEAMFKHFVQEMTTEKLEEARKAIEKDIERRKLEIANLIKFVEETLPPDMPAIILGDFNTTSESGELKPLLAGGKWIDSFRSKNPHEEGVTWDPVHNPNYRPAEKVKDPHGTLHAYHGSHPYRIDFILVNDRIPHDHILESRVVFTPMDGLSPSDHYGVLTTLKW
jgi:endonuclease/exonuclease/phosphatase family metal-dependent hydrolase